jgi:hypothetical protein
MFQHESAHLRPLAAADACAAAPHMSYISEDCHDPQ